MLNSLRPRRNKCHFADDTFQFIFLNENEWISLRFSLKFVPKVRINNIPSLVRPPTVVSFLGLSIPILTHIWWYSKTTTGLKYTTGELGDTKLSGTSPKVVALFSATNISSNKKWLFQLLDANQMKSKYTWTNYNRDNIALRSRTMIYNFLWKLFLVPNLVALISQKGEKCLFFRQSFVNL